MIIATNALFSDKRLHTIIETTIHIFTFTFIHKHVVNIVILYMCCFSDYLLLSVFKFNLKTNKRHKYIAFVLITDISKFPVFMLGRPKVIHFQRSFISTKVFFLKHCVLYSVLLCYPYPDVPKVVQSSIQRHLAYGKAIGLHFT